MVVFNEWFPIAKESIAAYAEQQQIAESQIAVIYPIQSIYKIQREPSTPATQNQDETDCHQFYETMSEKLEAIDIFDKNNYFVEPSHSLRSFDEIKKAESESFLSFSKPNEQMSIGESVCDLANGGVNTEKNAKNGIEFTFQKPQFTMSSEVQQKSILSTSSLMDVSYSKHVPKLHSTSRRLGSLTQQTEKILKEAKDKRKKVQTEIPIPVINLKFS